MVKEIAMTETQQIGKHSELKSILTIDNYNEKLIADAVFDQEINYKAFIEDEIDDSV